MSASAGVRLLRVSALVELAADLATVQTAAPLPPGTRVRLELPSSAGEQRLAPEGKVVGQERRDPKTYVVRVRLHNLSRDDRAALADLAAPRDDD